MKQGWLEIRGHLNGLAPERQAALSGEYPRKTPILWTATTLEFQLGK